MLQSQALKILADRISNCEKCEELTSYRKANNYLTVPGIGNFNAKIMILGEAPGANEAIKGEPFIGKAGKLLTNILENVGIKREHVFITNTVKCRPPDNRDPKPDEVVNCRGFLELQIRCINPEWIICFGRIASIYLLGKDQTTPMASMRNQTHDFQGRKVICTYHPSYLLRNPSAKKFVQEDLQPVVKNKLNISHTI